MMGNGWAFDCSGKRGRDAPATAVGDGPERSRRDGGATGMAAAFNHGNQTSTLLDQNSHGAAAAIDNACAGGMFGVFVAVVHDRDTAGESGGLELDPAQFGSLYDHPGAACDRG